MDFGEWDRLGNVSRVCCKVLERDGKGRHTVTRWGNANGACECGCEVGKNVCVLHPISWLSSNWVCSILTKFVATMVSKDFGLSTIRQVIASTSILSTFTSGKSFATSNAISSHITIPFLCALLLVTTVICFFGLFRAVSNAKRIRRSTPWRVKIDTSVAISQG
jgi:hypothetical protein